jgi:GT2 family glycosyltransferase
VTALVVTRDRPELARRAILSVSENLRLPWRGLLLDNGSQPAAFAELQRTIDDPRVELIREPVNLGCAGGRSRGIARVATELVLFLDDDAELLPGAVEHLVRELDAHPEAIAVAANVVSADGTVQGCGGDWSAVDGVLIETQHGAGRKFDDPAVGKSGPTRWISGAGGLYRTSAFSKAPIDPEMRAYFEDIEWCYRIEAERPGRLRRCVEALVVHHREPKVTAENADLLHSMPYVETIARFYAKHGLVLDGLFGFVHELVSPSGRRNVPAARLLLELVEARGADWTVLSLIGGDLAPLTEGIPSEELEKARRELARIKSSKWWKAAALFWRLRGRLRP